MQRGIWINILVEKIIVKAMSIDDVNRSHMADAIFTEPIDSNVGKDGFNII